MQLNRDIAPRLSLIKTVGYPQRPIDSSLPCSATIGLGGNVGDVLRRFKRLRIALQKDREIDVIATAPVLKNPPFGYEEQDDFLNTVIAVRTRLQPMALLRKLLHYEKRFGRIRTFANAPRTLDMDILFFENRQIATRGLMIPHPHWHERASVLIPLAYLKASLLTAGIFHKTRLSRTRAFYQEKRSVTLVVEKACNG